MHVLHPFLIEYGDVPEPTKPDAKRSIIPLNRSASKRIVQSVDANGKKRSAGQE
jgi:hypothetical protein